MIQNIARSSVLPSVGQSAQLVLQCLQPTPLIFKKIQTPEEIKRMKHILDTWRTFRPLLRELNEDPRLCDCKGICFLLQSSLDAREISSQLYAVEDRSGKTQGIMSLEKTSTEIRIKHLVTNPSNLIPALSRDKHNPQPIRGSGTALAKMAMFLAIQEGKSCVSLYSYPSAIRFYKKLGFSELSTTPQASFMKLEAEKICQLHPHLGVVR